MTSVNYQIIRYLRQRCYVHDTGLPETQYHHQYKEEITYIKIHQSEVASFKALLAYPKYKCSCKNYLPLGQEFSIQTNTLVQNEKIIGPFPKGTSELVKLILNHQKDLSIPNEILSGAIEYLNLSDY